jgi:hypothetical protein
MHLLTRQPPKTMKQPRWHRSERSRYDVFRVPNSYMITKRILQRKKKAAKGETRAAVDKVKASLKAAGKKKANVESQTTRYI